MASEAASPAAMARTLGVRWCSPMVSVFGVCMGVPFRAPDVLWCGVGLDNGPDRVVLMLNADEGGLLHSGVYGIRLRGGL